MVYSVGNWADYRGVKGAVSGADESTPETARMDLKIILLSVLRMSKSRPSQTSLATYIDNENPSWEGFVNSFHATERELKAIRLLRMISRPDIFNSIRVAYMGILWRDLSIDLVAAALRHREFAKKITSEECRGMENPFVLYKANSRYDQFLLMNRKPPSKRRCLIPVPTLDIDLYWRSNQLFPARYRHWCIKQFETTINHDDTIGRGDLGVRLRETSLAWYDAYREPYTIDDLRQSYFTTSRKIAGALFPPYGLYMLIKGKKLNHARLGMSNKFDC